LVRGIDEVRLIEYLRDIARSLEREKGIRRRILVGKGVLLQARRDSLARLLFVGLFISEFNPRA
jgi:hypothetical protein